MDRTKGIGGTDIAAIVGLNPWKKPIDVYMEKLGLVEPQADNEAMWWGREMEPVLQKRYEQETGHKVKSCGPIQHDLKSFFPWAVGTPDGIIPPDGGVDYKTTGYSKLSDWGESGTDEVPPYYHCQAMWYMGLTGAKWWDIAVLFMGARREFRIYRVNRDQELIDSLIAKAKDFWENHVVPQIPPPVDASPGWDKFFKKHWPEEKEDVFEISNPDDLGLWMLKEAEDNFKLAKAELDFQQNTIKAFLQEYSIIKVTGCKITWKKSKDRIVTDWQQSYMDLCGYCHDKGLVINDEDFSGKHTTIKPGPRVFKTYWNKENE